MTKQQPFGGNWTQDKLYRLEGYLNVLIPIHFSILAAATSALADHFWMNWTISSRISEGTQRPFSSPQEIFLAGYAPLKARKVSRVYAGASVPVRGYAQHRETP